MYGKCKWKKNRFEISNNVRNKLLELRMYVSTYADMKLIPDFTFVALIARVRYVHIVRTTGHDLIQLIFNEYVHYTTNKVATTFLLISIHLWLERAIKSNGKNISISFPVSSTQPRVLALSIPPDPRDDESKLSFPNKNTIFIIKKKK